MKNPEYISRLECDECLKWVHLYEIDFGGPDILHVCYDCCIEKGWL